MLREDQGGKRSGSVEKETMRHVPTSPLPSSVPALVPRFGSERRLLCAARVSFRSTHLWKRKVVNIFTNLIYPCKLPCSTIIHLRLDRSLCYWHNLSLKVRDRDWRYQPFPADVIPHRDSALRRSSQVHRACDRRG